MVFLLFAILDFARIYTAMMSVESAAREAADYGTALGAERWSAATFTDTVEEMERRACVAASDLPDFDWTDTDVDGVIDKGETCINPGFDWCISLTTGGACDKAYPQALDPANPGTIDCDNRNRIPPCTVTVTMAHEFHLFVPFQIDFFGVKLGLPVTIDFERDSTYAMTDIDVASPSPGP